MENFVTRSKYVSETISIFVDFADTLPAGQTIQGAPVVSVALDTGDDPTPASILYLGVSVTNGTIVEQRFRLGVPGVIYEITWQIISTSNEVFEKTTYLAILPNIGSVAPNHQYLFLTSDLYPLQAQDSFQSSFQALSGQFWLNPTDLEKFKTYIQLSDGSFWLAQLFYTNPVEQFQAIFTPQDGLWTPVGSQSYTCPAEKFQASFAPLAGTFVEAQVFYTTKTDEFKAFFTPLNGTFG
ncbi:MAG TPA: hypothetical protein V6C65_35080 [Allocoleopsis sp.]